MDETNNNNNNNNIGHWDGKCYCRKMLEFFKIKIKIRIVEVFKNTENEQLFRS
jgi:hypothetical protein